MKSKLGVWFVSSLALVLATGCGGDDEEVKPPPENCSVVEQTGCEEAGEGFVCEEVTGGGTSCFAPIKVEGRVFDTADDAGIEAARVVARDANDVAVSGVAISAADGTYSLPVPVPRNEDGSPAGSVQYTLRADAAGYLTFPKAPRLALPVEVTNAVDGVVTSAATDIGLIALDDATGLGSISGTVLADAPAGTLVVAGAVTGLADRDGDYTVFNVPAGSNEVRGYLQGINLESKSVDVVAGENVADVDLAVLNEGAVTVSGKVEIVNPGDGSDTSVILVVEDTFVENAARGEAPPGLRVGNVAGDWSIPGVPDGNYVVLAAFENDFLVRDPDTAIGGTEIVHISVPADQALDQSFKVTGALDVVSPDNEAAVSGTPSFVWNDDSGEDHYEIRVFDAFGNLIWEKVDVPGVSGSKTVTVAYAGDALDVGMLYQFRATSIKQGGTPISVTEDLKGTFIYEGQ